MRVLITGAAGFIGSHAARRLARAGHEVVGLDVIDPAKAGTLQRMRLATAGFSSSALTYVVGDVRDEELLRRVMGDYRPTAVLHLAALAGVGQSMVHPEPYWSVNVQGTAALLTACERAGVRRFVFASSSSVYGEAPCGRAVSETDAPGQMLSVYARTKWEAEELVRGSAMADRAAVLRFFTVYGPMGRPDMMPWQFAKRLSRGESVPIHEGTKRDFTHVDDVTRAVQVVLEEGTGSVLTFNVASGHPASPLLFCKLLGASLGVEPQPRLEPRPPELPSTTWGDSAALGDAYAWSPRTTLDQGVADFARWFLEYGFQCDQGSVEDD